MGTWSDDSISFGVALTVPRVLPHSPVPLESCWEEWELKEKGFLFP